MRKLPDATVLGNTSKKGDVRDAHSAAVVQDPAKDALRAEQSVAQKRILDALTIDHDVLHHEEVIAFCTDHELVEQAHALSERLTSEYATLASLQTEFDTLRIDLHLSIPNHASAHVEKIAVATTSNVAVSSDSLNPSANSSAPSERDSAPIPIVKNEENTTISSDTQSSLAAQSLLVHAGMQRLGDLLSLYSQKVARDFVDAQRAADRKLSEYNTVRRKAQRYAERRLIPDVHAAPSGATQQSAASNQTGAAKGAGSNTHRVGVVATTSKTNSKPSRWRDWITSETESESESDSSESERESEKWARFEIALAQRLSTHHEAYQTARCGALTKLQMAAAYRTRSLDDAFLLLARLQLVYYAPIESENMSRLDSSETLSRLRNILRQHMVTLPHEPSAAERDRRVAKSERKSSAASALVGSVVSLLSAPTVRDSVRSLADTHRRTIDKSRRTTPLSLKSTGTVSNPGLSTSDATTEDGAIKEGGATMEKSSEKSSCD